MGIVCLVSTFAVATFAQERFVKPVDDAKLDASFLAFRTKLIAAAERRDANYILSIVDPKIKNGFGGEDGIANFKRQWKLTAKNSKFWNEFLAAIKNGGAFGEGRTTFTAPYTFSSWPQDIDGFEYHAIFGNNVNLRKEPEMNAAVVTKLSYNVVKIERELVPKSGKSEYPEWWLVKTLGGLEGYVKREFVRGHIDYRAGFTKKKGVWKLDFFLAGD